MDLDNYMNFDTNKPSAPINWDKITSIKIGIREFDKEESKIIIKKNIYKVKEQQRKSKPLSKKKLYLEMLMKKSMFHNAESDSYTTIPQFGSSNSFDFASSSNNSDDDSTFYQE